MNKIKNTIIVILLILIALLLCVDIKVTSNSADAAYTPIPFGYQYASNAQVIAWNAKSNFSGIYADLTSKPTLGTASTQATAFFATALQGTEADSALQPAGNGAGLTGLIQSQISGLAAAFAAKFDTPLGTIGQYVRGDGTLATLPVLNYKSYQGILTQSSTGAPSVTIGQNDFGATTFTWTRLGAGSYRVTASTAVFTANKTVIVLGDPSSSLVNYTAVVNSTTTATISTSTLSVITLILNAVTTDGLLTNTLVDIRVYN